MGNSCATCLILPLPWCFIACYICKKHTNVCGHVDTASINIEDCLDGFGNLTLPDGSDLHFDVHAGRIGFPNGQIFEFGHLTEDPSLPTPWEQNHNMSTLFTIGEITVAVDNTVTAGLNLPKLDEIYLAKMAALRRNHHPRSIEVSDISLALVTVPQIGKTTSADCLQMALPIIGVFIAISAVYFAYTRGFKSGQAKKTVRAVYADFPGVEGAMGKF